MDTGLEGLEGKHEKRGSLKSERYDIASTMSVATVKMSRIHHR